MISIGRFFTGLIFLCAYIGAVALCGIGTAECRAALEGGYDVYCVQFVSCVNCHERLGLSFVYTLVVEVLC